MLTRVMLQFSLHIFQIYSFAVLHTSLTLMYSHITDTKIHKSKLFTSHSIKQTSHWKMLKNVTLDWYEPKATFDVISNTRFVNFRDETCRETNGCTDTAFPLGIYFMHFVQRAQRNHISLRTHESISNL